VEWFFLLTTIVKMRKSYRRMTLKVLEIIFTVGRFLAITPPNINIKINFYQKLYALLLITLIGLGILRGWVYKNFYMNFVHMKMIVSLLTDCNIFAFNCAVVVNSSLTKREEWCKLVENLKNEQQNNLKSSKLPLLWLILVHIFVSAFITYQLFFVRISGLRYLIVIALPMVQMYIRALYNVLLLEILNLMLLKYKFLIQSLSDFKSKKVSSVFVKKIKSCACVLKDTVDVFNDIFGWPIALVILHTCFVFLKFLDQNVAVNHRHRMDVYAMVLTNLSLVFMTLVRTRRFFLLGA
jgi:gustatory receptor